MSETKEPYKTYWAYQYSKNEKIHLFNSKQEAIDFAEEMGAFQHARGHEEWKILAKYIIFEVNESQLEDYTPFEIIN